MKITLTRTVGGLAKGATIDRIDSVAEHLIAAGAAVATEPTKAEKVEKVNATDTKAKRTRRSQRRDEVADEADGSTTTTGADKPAGQEGGGVPPRSPATTAG